MTLLVIAVAIVPLFWLLVLIQHELLDAYRGFTAYLSEGPHALPAAVREIPWLGAWLQDGLNRYANDPTALRREITDGLQPLRGQLAALLGGVGRNVGKLLVAMLTLFFFYRDGDLLVRQTKRVGKRFFGDRLDRSVHAAGMMTRAVVYGLVITALAQGLIAGIGYWIFGLDAPALLGALTGLLSTAPLLGTAFIWAPLGVWLVVAGHTWKGVLLLAWGGPPCASDRQSAAAASDQQCHSGTVSLGDVRCTRWCRRVRARGNVRWSRCTWRGHRYLAGMGGRGGQRYLALSKPWFGFARAGS